MLEMDRLRTQHRINPLGIDARHPVFRWAWRGEAPVSWRLQVWQEDSAGPIWDSGALGMESQLGLRYAGPPLQSRRRYHWRVGSDRGAWSSFASFEMGLLEPEDWQAEWVGYPAAASDDGRTLYLRGHTTLPGTVVRARAYASALGWYRLFVNDTDVTGDALVPRWTPLDHIIEYQVYDVTGALRTGSNFFSLAVGDGRYRGALGITHRRAVYGKRLAGLLQIEAELADGRIVRTVSDTDWWAGGGRILRSDPMGGEIADLRIDERAWLAAGVPPTGFVPAEPLPRHPRRLVAEEVERVRAVGWLRPERILRSPAGKYLIDFGQNIAGVPALTLEGPAGERVDLTASEVLTPQGELDIDYVSLIGPAAPQRDVVTLAGEPTRYQPRFTLHGFRFLEVSGPVSERALRDAEAAIISTDLEEVGRFCCSDERLNRLFQNIKWSMRANFTDTATDCPTRERSGWTGDIQIFGETATMLFDVAAFLGRYIDNLGLEQWADGTIPPFIPAECSKASGRPSVTTRVTRTSTGWGDVAVVLPWTLYQAYGDPSFLERGWTAMTRWVGYLETEARTKRGRGRWFSKRLGAHDRYILGSGFQWGEWLRAGDRAPQVIRDLLIPDASLATAYFALSAGILAKAADVLGREREASAYEVLARRVREAWRAAFVREDGLIGQNRQEDYIRALAFELLPAHERPAAAERLAQLVAEADHHLATGFLSTSLLLPTLGAHGYAETAYRVLMQTTTPSWLHQVEQGATTTWETWPGYTRRGRAYMSHNHYAFGSVASWMIDGIAGLGRAAPGYRRLRIAPKIGGDLTHATASVMTPFGTASSGWERRGDQVTLLVEVPPGTTAEILFDGRHEVEAGCYRFTGSVSGSDA